MIKSYIKPVLNRSQTDFKPDLISVLLVNLFFFKADIS